METPEERSRRISEEFERRRKELYAKHQEEDRAKGINREAPRKKKFMRYDPETGHNPHFSDDFVKKTQQYQDWEKNVKRIRHQFEHGHAEKIGPNRYTTPFLNRYRKHPEVKGSAILHDPTVEIKRDLSAEWVDRMVEQASKLYTTKSKTPGRAFAAYRTDLYAEAWNLRTLSMLLNNLAQGATEGLEEAARKALRESNKNVPVDTGSLRDSAWMERDDQGDAFCCNLGYGYTATRRNPKSFTWTDEYALEVHEDVTVKHKVGRAKFLAIALRRTAQTLEHDVAVGIRRRMNVKV